MNKVGGIGSETTVRCGSPAVRLPRLAALRASLVLIVLLLSVFLVGCSQTGRYASKATLSIAEVHRLAQHASESGEFVRIRGVVTYSEPLSRDCMIQDQTGGIHVILQKSGSLEAGQLVEAEGVVRVAGSELLMMEPELHPKGTAPLPAPDPIDFSEPDLANHLNRLVSFRGVARSISESRPSVKNVSFRSSGTRVTIRVGDYPSRDPETLIDADSLVVGVLARVGIPGDSSQPYRIWSQDLRSIRILKPAPPLHELPIVSAASVQTAAAGKLPEHRIRLNGKLTSTADGFLTLNDISGAFPLRLESGTGLTPGNTMDLAGFLASENGELFLDSASPARREDVQGTLVQTAAALHQLTPRRAALGLPVRLRAIITYINWFYRYAFVQDSSDAIFVQLSSKFDRSARVGDLVEIEGATNPGGFAAIVNHAAARVLGHRSLPPPEPDVEEALTGHRDCHWVEFRGVVQSVAPGYGGTNLIHVVWGTHSFNANVGAPERDLTPLIDRTVYVRGAVGAIFNQNRQFQGVQLFVPGMEYIRSAPDLPSVSASSQPRPAASLLQFSPTDEMGHRLRFRGVVTYSHETGPTWIRDSSGGLLIENHDPIQLERGNLVEVSGFARTGAFNPVVTGASIQKIRSGNSVEPIPVSVEDAIEGSFDCQLVSIEGTIVSSSLVQADLVITMQSGPYLFDARISMHREARTEAIVSALKPGAKVRVAGICTVTGVTAKEWLAPSSFEIQVRSPADLEIVKPARWLTAERLIAILAIFAVIVCVAVGWILVLRRSVRVQTSKLTEALQRTRQAESLEQERKALLERVARDEPIDHIMHALANTVTHHIPGAACAIQIESADGTRFVASSGVPEQFIERLSRLEPASIRKNAGLTPVSELSGSHQWISDPPDSPFPKYRALPVLRESASRHGKDIGSIIVLSPGNLVAAPRDAEVIESACQLASLAAERRELYEQLSYRAKFDNVTSLVNRASLYERLEIEISKCATGGGKIAILYLDLDGFKSINDGFGHAAGDAVLREVAVRIRANVRHTDICARVGGDEFVIVLTGIENIKEAERVASLVKVGIDDPIAFQGETLRVGASLGISLYPVDGDSCEAVLRVADERMYQLKRGARNFELLRA